MENVAANVGSFVCQMVANSVGSGQAACYNPTAAATIGYGIFFGLGLLLGFRHIFSRVG